MHRNSIIIAVGMVALLLVAMNFVNFIPALIIMVLVGLSIALWAVLSDNTRRHDHLHNEQFVDPDTRHRRYDGL
jgi:hypothetical protein